MSNKRSSKKDHSRVIWITRGCRVGILVSRIERCYLARLRQLSAGDRQIRLRFERVDFRYATTRTCRRTSVVFTTAGARRHALARKAGRISKKSLGCVINAL